jgi:hypothetical protein
VPDELTRRPTETEATEAPPAPPAPPSAPAPPASPAPAYPAPASPAPLAAGPPTHERGARPPRRPSWVRALLLSLVVLAAGALVGVAGYRYEISASVEPPQLEQTARGWLITAHQRREFSGLALNDTRLLWQNGASIEYLDLATGRLRLLGPGPGMRATWDPAVGERYAIWFEAERQSSLAASAVAYDTQSGRRWTVADIGSVRSYPAISGDVAVWCSAPALGQAAINGVRIGSAEPFEVAAEEGAPVVSGGLVVWASSWTGPFVAQELGSGASWPVAAGLSDGRLTSLALAGRTLVWGQASEATGGGVVATAGVDGGETAAVASGLSGLSGPACDGRTIVWGEQAADGARVMGRRLNGGPSFVVAEAEGTVKEVAVSGDTVAWISVTRGARYTLVTTGLPR